MKSFYCAYPYFHLQVKPNGLVKPCCRFELNEEFPEVVVNSNINFILESYQWENLRTKMFKGDVPFGCRKCFEEEKKGKISLRQSVNNQMSEISLSTNYRPKLEDIEIGFSNRCNLACRTCDSHLSSSWYEDDQYLSNVLDFRYPLVDERFLNRTTGLNVEELQKYIRSIKFTGGEPFLQQEALQLTKALAKSERAREISLRFCTNLTVLPSEKFFIDLKKFHKIDFSLSIDGLGLYNDYIRYPSRWKNIKKNLDKIKKIVQDSDGMSLTLCPTVSAYSYESLPDLLDWWREYSFDIEQSQIYLQEVKSPDYLSPRILPMDKFELEDEFLDNKNLRWYFDGSLYNESRIDKFKKFNYFLDKKRNLSFSKIFTVLAKVLS